MKKQLFMLLCGVSLLSWAGGLTEASQLEGLQLKPVNGKVQVILKTSGEQPYQVENHRNGDATIVLPKANLPGAFQGSGLPTVTHKQTGMKAEIRESGDNIEIRVKGMKNGSSPEILVQSPAEKSVPLPQSPLTLMKPNASQLSGLMKELSHEVNRSPQPYVMPELTVQRAKPTTKTAMSTLKKKTAPSKTLVAQVPKKHSQIRSAHTEAPYKRTAPFKPAAVAHKAQPPVQAAKSKSPVVAEAIPQAPHPNVVYEVESPKGTPNAQVPDKTEVAQVPAEAEGYNFLQQAIENKTETEAPVTTEAVNPEESLYPLEPGSVTESVAPAEETAAPKTPAENRFSQSILQWLLVSAALVGGLIIVAIGIAIWIRRRIRKETQSFDHFAASRDYYQEQASAAPEFPEEEDDYYSLQKAPSAGYDEFQPEFYDDEPELPPEPVRSQAAASPIRPIQPVAPKPQAPRETQMPVEPEKKAPVSPLDSLLFHPASSPAEAISTVFGVKANPYLTSPIHPSKPDPTHGGPRPKKRPSKPAAAQPPITRSAAANPRFNQYLSS